MLGVIGAAAIVLILLGAFGSISGAVSGGNTTTINSTTINSNTTIQSTTIQSTTDITSIFDTTQITSQFITTVSTQITANSCTTAKYAVSINGTGFLGCKNVQWGNLTAYPSGSGGCAIGTNFVYKINSTNYYCSNVSFTSLTNLPTGCSSGQYAIALTSTALTCSAVGWMQLTGFPSACSSGQFVTTIGSTITCSAVAWNQITSFPSGSGSCASGSNYVYKINGTNYYCSAPMKNSTFWFVNSGNLVVNGHYYGLSGATSASEIPVSVFCPYAGYFSDLAFQLTASPGTGAAVIVTLDRNTIGQSLVATCTNPATTCIDNTHSVYCAGGANNYVDFALTETGVVTAGLSIGISVDYVGNGV